jgi:hypothetical protein
MQTAVTAAGRASDDAMAKVRDLEQTNSSLESIVGALHKDWSGKSDSAVAAARESSEAVLASVRERIETSLGGIREALEKQTGVMREHGELVTGGTGRLVAAGHALLGYLAERDRIVEDERTQSFHELLDAFAEGMSAKERRKTSERLSDALERRRNAQDADRYRKQLAGEQPATIPAPPADLAALAGPLAPPRAPKKAATKATEELRPAPLKSAKKTAAKKTAVKKTAAKKVAKKTPVKKAVGKTAASSPPAPPAMPPAPVPAPAAAPARKTPVKKAAVRKAAAGQPPERTAPEAPVSGETGQVSGPSDQND